MTEKEAIKAFGENCKWLREKVRELQEQIERLEEKLGKKTEQQKRIDREDEEVFRLVHGTAKGSDRCLHVRIR